ELETVCLRLIAGEEENRTLSGRRLGRREVTDVDRVVEDLPRSARLRNEGVGGALRELALVQDVVGRLEHTAVPPIQLPRVASRPARVGDAVLIEHDRRRPQPGERE